MVCCLRAGQEAPGHTRGLTWSIVEERAVHAEGELLDLCPHGAGTSAGRVRLRRATVDAAIGLDDPRRDAGGFAERVATPSAGARDHRASGRYRCRDELGPAHEESVITTRACCRARYRDRRRPRDPSGARVEIRIQQMLFYPPLTKEKAEQMCKGMGDGKLGPARPRSRRPAKRYGPPVSASTSPRHSVPNRIVSLDTTYCCA